MVFEILYDFGIYKWINNWGIIFMTEKRFVYYEHKGADYILDTPNKSLDFIEMLGDCLEAEEIVDLLNCLNDENKQLKFENNELKCALALDAVDYIITDGKKIDIPPYYEFEQRYDHVMHRREYDGYD